MTLRLAISGISAGTFKDSNGEQYPIVVRPPLDGRPDLPSLERARVTNALGESIPLSQLGRLSFDAAPVLIAAGVLLGAAVFAAVHHAEVLALALGEPFGSILLALAVTVIEVGLILTLMQA